MLMCPACIGLHCSWSVNGSFFQLPTCSKSTLSGFPPSLQKVQNTDAWWHFCASASYFTP